MSTSAFKQSIQTIGAELRANIDFHFIQNPGFYENLGPNDTEEACLQLFWDANTLMLHPSPSGQLPESDLTRQALSTIGESSLISSVGTSPNGSCFQSELRLARSLRRQTTHSPKANRLPAAVLFGQDEAPFAYQKDDGYPTAYAWRSSYMETDSGPRWIPCGAIFEVCYGGRQKLGVYQDDPRHNFRGAGLIELHDSMPADVRLKRFSVEFLPDAIRYAALGFAALDEERLAPYQSQAGKLTHHVVERQSAKIVQLRRT